MMTKKITVRISFVEIGMSVEDVHSLLDVPHGFHGSGLMDSYSLEDGSKLIIIYGMYRDTIKEMTYYMDNDTINGNVTEKQLRLCGE